MSAAARLLGIGPGVGGLLVEEERGVWGVWLVPAGEMIELVSSINRSAF